MQIEDLRDCNHDCFGDLEIGSVFSIPLSDRIFMKIEPCFDESSHVECNAINLQTGRLRAVSDTASVECLDATLSIKAIK